MRVLVYTPVRLFGEGLAAFLATIESIGAVQVEHDPLALGETVDDFEPDVVLIDVTGRGQLSAARSLRAHHPDLAVIALAVPEVAEEVIACAEAGFVAYVPRGASIAEMFNVVDGAARGETVCHPRIARSLFDELSRRPERGGPASLDVGFTHREAQTARLMVKGLSNKEIAGELSLSLPTVKNHVHSVLQKLQVGRRSQVSRLVTENPWILRAGTVAPVSSKS